MMVNWLKSVWQSLHGSEAKTLAEVERIAALQQAAVQRRAEYAEENERQGSAARSDAVTPARKRVQEAEAAYAAALQIWDNKQFRR
jgi:hypothetical protein